jgi:3-methylfumaryl-CoA hydratase
LEQLSNGGAVMTQEPITNWLGRQEILEEILAPGPAQGLAATLNLDPENFAAEGAILPPVWNWLYFLPRAPSRQIGPDGHPKRGGFLPPITLARRMWAGSRCTFHHDLHIGDRATKTSTILKINEKQGRAGTMFFVTVRHEIRVDAILAYEEEQDIVYMDIPKVFTPPEPVPLPACTWHHDVPLDPVLLFRFSALTFNGHRIHYDRDYAMGVENYPGLVVHGPLQAILGFHFACLEQPDRKPQAFRFKGVRPLFDFDALSFNGAQSEPTNTQIYAANGDQAVTMEAQMTWA